MTTHDTRLSLLEDRHVTALAAEPVRAEPDTNAFALCLCTDGQHTEPDRMPWLTTAEAAWAEHVYVPNGAAVTHVVPRVVVIGPALP